MSFRSRGAQLEELASGRLGPLLLKYSWPALVTMSLNALYAVVDRFYIGHGCGEAAMAGLTLVFPIMLLLGAFGVFVGAGHSAVLSIRLGEGDRVACEKLLGQLVAIKLIFFFLLPPLIYFNLDTVLGWCGGGGVSAAALAAAKRYLKIVLFSHLFSHLAFGFSAMMRAEGSALRSMTAMCVGFGVNLVLDPIFIFGLDLGIAGAAWATNIAMVASFLTALTYYLGGSSIVKLRLARIRLYPRLLAKPCGIGFAPFLQQLLGAFINVALPAAFAKWAADEAAATIKGFLGKSGASLGSSKSLVDMPEAAAAFTFMSHMNQVGQTGSTPRHAKGLATCCHGEEPHVVGWRFINERRAVNLDANCGWAQGKADVLYVADAFEVMKKVNELLG